jgi:hypothetical protein
VILSLMNVEKRRREAPTFLCAFDVLMVKFHIQVYTYIKLDIVNIVFYYY